MLMNPKLHHLVDSLAPVSQEILSEIVNIKSTLLRCLLLPWGWLCRTLHLSVCQSAWVGAALVVALYVVKDCGPSQCGWPPRVASSLPQVSVPGHASLMSNSV